jgi:carboxypeptidase Q
MESAMKGSFRLCVIGIVAALLIAFFLQRTALAGSKQELSADHPEILAGTWVLDLKQSSLGSDPYEQFDAWKLTFTRVTTTTLAWTSNATIRGKTITFSWTGPIDGSPKPLIGTEGSDAYRWRKNALIRLSDLGDGETKRDTVTISRDGETMTIQDRSTTPHGVLFATLVMRRQWAQNAPASTPPAHSFRERLTTLTDSDSRPWTAEQFATMGRIRDAAMIDPNAYNMLAHLTDNIGPRLSGSLQAQAAVEWVAARMREMGAAVTLEKTTVPHWVRGQEDAVLTMWPGMSPGTTQKIVVTALGNSVATSEDGLTANVIVVSSFAELRNLPVDEVKGKIVLFNKPFDKELAEQGFGVDAYAQNGAYRVIGPSFGASLGAAAVLVRSLGSADFRLPHTGVTLYGEGVEKVPAAAIAAEDADLLARLSKQGPVTMRLTLTPKTLPPANSYNVIADWKGSEHPEEVVLVSGHLDSWDLGTGAIDDGAGIAISMQTIHLLQSLNIHPKRTIRFVAWMNEEFGASGATTYLQEHSSELTDHIAALESDLGCDHPTGLTFFGVPEAARYLAPVADALAPIGASVLTRSDEVTAEDIAGMVELGVPGLRPSQDSRFYFNYHHSAADTLDKVNVQQLNENAAVMAVTAYALADAPEAIPRRK